MKKRRSYDVFCQCGQKLAKYEKGGKGKLRKMFLDRIQEDYIHAFQTIPPRKLHDEIACPSCTKRVATIQIIDGKYAAKMNQGAIEQL